jgi:predicted ATPase
MLLYALDGQRAAALRQYQECVRQLEQELGVAPLPETTALYRAIQENRLRTEDGSDELRPRRRTRADEWTVEDAPKAPVRAHSYPLVGRAEELETLLRAYERSSARSSPGGGQLVVIQGEAGIGKTRLAEEALATLGARGATILSARSYAEQRALAYAPFAQALGAALLEPPLAARLTGLAGLTLVEAARLVPELKPNVPASAPEGPGAQARFFEAVTQVILALTRNGATGVLFLDDAQWLDDASLDLLAFLIRRLNTAPLFILLTWRVEEIARDHPLRQLYADALREERAQLIGLSRLERAQAQRLIQVAAARGAPIDASLAERLYRDSEGQPFFLVEALKLLERNDALPADDA